MDAHPTKRNVSMNANPEQFTDAPHEHKPDADQNALDLQHRLDDIAGSDDARPE